MPTSMHILHIISPERVNQGHRYLSSWNLLANQKIDKKKPVAWGKMGAVSGMLYYVHSFAQPAPQKCC